MEYWRPEYCQSGASLSSCLIHGHPSSGGGGGPHRSGSGRWLQQQSSSMTSFSHHHHHHHHHHHQQHTHTQQQYRRHTPYPMIYMEDKTNTEDHEDDDDDDDEDDDATTEWMHANIGSSSDRIGLENWIAVTSFEPTVAAARPAPPAAIYQPAAAADECKPTPYKWLIFASVLASQMKLTSVITTFSTESLWEDSWGYLSTDPGHYNLVFTLQSAGRLCGTIGGGLLIDVLSRRTLLLFSAGLSTIMGSLSAAASDFSFYSICRALSALFAGPLPPSVVVYGVCFTDSTNRSFPAALNQITGALMVAFAVVLKIVLEASGDRSDDTAPSFHRWRVYNVLMQLPTFLVIALCLFPAVFPESPNDIKHASKQSGCANPNITKQAPQPPKLKFRDRIRKVGSELSAQPLAFTALALTWAFHSFSNWGLQSYSTILLERWGLATNWILLAWYGCQALVAVGWMKFLHRNRIQPLRYGTFLVAISSLLLGVGLVVSQLAVADSSTVARISLQVVTGIMCVMVGANSGALWACIYFVTAEAGTADTRGLITHAGAAISAASSMLTSYLGSTTIRDGKNKTYILPFVWFGLHLATFALTYMLPTPTPDSSSPPDHHHDNHHHHHHSTKRQHHKKHRHKTTSGEQHHHHPPRHSLEHSDSFNDPTDHNKHHHHHQRPPWNDEDHHL